MKLEDARRLATRGLMEEKAEVNAALLSHCYEHFDEVVEALEWMIQHRHDNSVGATIRVGEYRELLIKAKDVKEAVLGPDSGNVGV